MNDDTISLCIYSDSLEGMNSARNCVDGEWKLLTLKDNTITEMINSDTFKQARLKLLNGEWPSQCKQCMEKEEQNLESMRQAYKKKGLNAGSYYSFEDAARETRDDGSIDLKLTKVELRFGNVCNLKCRICKPLYSKKWKEDSDYMDAEFYDIYNEGNYELTQNNSLETKRVWEELVRSRTIQYFYLGGGEPLILKGHWDFLRYMIEHQMASGIMLDYNTNITYLPDYAYDIWKEFRTVLVVMSVDGIGKHNEYMRNGVAWSKILENMKKIKAMSNDKIMGEIRITATWLNVYYLDEIVEFMFDMGFDVSIQYVYWPWYLRPHLLPEDIKNDIASRCKQVMNKDLYDQLYASLFNNPSDIEMLKEGIRFNKNLDRLRGESFKDTFPELYEKIKTYWDSK
jgi:MoaA/NifB/PqqE/SkfB family radical SAM enzyme